MPLHDWTRVPSGLFHDFHQSWSIRIKDALNAGLLPEGTVALVEQRASGREPDVLAIESSARTLRRDIETSGGVVLKEPPVGMLVQTSDRVAYARRANRIVIRHHLGRIIAVIEIISPGNKDSRKALERFVEKTVDFLEDYINVLVVDPFPPTPRDPLGIHQVIWEEFAGDARFDLPPGEDRVLVSYERGHDWHAYVRTVGLGDPLPDMPLFLTNDLDPNLYVLVPLESTYVATWEALPKEVRVAVETGTVPGPELG